MNLSLSCQSHQPADTNLWSPKKINNIFTVLGLSYLFYANHYVMILVLTDPILQNSPSFRKMLNFICSINKTIQIFSFMLILMNAKLLRFALLKIICLLISQPYDCFALWYILLRIYLSKDIHKNPGPYSEFSSSFFTFCNWNLNSLSKDDFYRIHLLEAHNTNFNYDIISLCETSLNETLTVKENSLPGYNFVSQNNPDGSKNGGVGMFYKETLPLKIRHDLSFGECLVSEINFGRKKIFFTVLYRNPKNKAASAEFENFMQNFTLLTTELRKAKPYALFFTGDFNAHSQSWYSEANTNTEGQLLDDLFTSLNLDQIISEPTHFFRDDCKPSCIDLIITDQPNLVLESGVRPSLDPSVKHQIVFSRINYRIPPPPKIKRKIWHYISADPGLIKRAIANYPWVEKLENLENPNEQVTHLTDCILNIMSNFIPNEVKTFSSRDPEWFNRDVKNLLRKQNKLFKKLKKNGYRNEDKVALDKIREESSLAIKTARECFLRKEGLKLADSNTGEKTYWKILNKFLNKNHTPRIPPILCDNKYIFEYKDKAKIFNDYFVSQCRLFESNSTLPSFEYLTNSRLADITISTNEISEILIGLNEKKSHGPDRISAKMIKLCGNELAFPLKIIFDNILATGIFPKQWKEANVTPIHKKNDKQDVTNYRPISLLPIFSKVFEKIIFKNIYNHLISNNLISTNQSGFRPGDSCTNQLLSLVHDIQNAFNDVNCLEVRSVYLDMSKAFDKVWHEGLIFKLKQNGVDGKLLCLLKNYLSQRVQRVLINGFESDWGDIQSGVPQGSVLGPLLFLIYVNDLEKGIRSNIKFFADDTSLFSVVKDPVISADNLNYDLNLIKDWAIQWKMNFNPDPDKPAEEVLFSLKRKEEINHPPLFFNNTMVKRVDDHKHLGLILDSKLNFKKHINEKISTARKWIGIIKQVSPYLPLNSLIQIYKMHIRPHLDYCDVIFHLPSQANDLNSSLSLNSTMNIIERTQYQAALAVTGAWQGSNRNKIYEELGWETLDLRRHFHQLVMFYKIMNGLTPMYLKSPITERTRFSSRLPPQIPCILSRTEKFYNSFYPNTIRSWNNLDPTIRCSPTLSLFKKRLVNIIRPTKKEIFNVVDCQGLKWIFQLRLELSPLKSHKKRHNFADMENDSCWCSNSSETTYHFFLICPRYNAIRLTLFDHIKSVLLPNNINFDDINLIKLLLYGHEELNFSENRKILESSIKFINLSGRFD